MAGKFREVQFSRKASTVFIDFRGWMSHELLHPRLLLTAHIYVHTQLLYELWKPPKLDPMKFSRYVEATNVHVVVVFVTVKFENCHGSL